MFDFFKNSNKCLISHKKNIYIERILIPIKTQWIQTKFFSRFIK